MLGNWILVQQKKDGITLELQENMVTFGRHRSCTFSFKSSYLSRVHAIMQYDGTQWAIKDANSMNGVFIRTCQIPSDEFVNVKEGDIIGIGMPSTSSLREDHYGVYKLQRRYEEPERSLIAEKDGNNENVNSEVVPVQENVGKELLKRKTKYSEEEIILSSDDEDAVESGKEDPTESAIACTSKNTDKMNFEECKYSQDDEIIEISDDENEVFQVKREADIKSEDEEVEGVRYKHRMQEQLDWNDEFNANDNFSTVSISNLQSEFWCPPSPEVEIIESEEDETVSTISIKKEIDTCKISIKENIVQIASTENITTETSSCSIFPSDLSKVLVRESPVLSETVHVFEDKSKKTEGENTTANENKIDSLLFKDGEQFFPILSQTFEESNNEMSGCEITENENPVNEQNDETRLQLLKQRIAHKPIVDRLKQSSRRQGLLHFVAADYLKKKKAAVANINAPCTSNRRTQNKPKTESMQNKVLKMCGNRLRVPGGGSAIRSGAGGSSAKRHANKVENRNVNGPSTSHESTVKKVNSDHVQKTSDECEDIPEAKSKRTKVYQKSGASRNERLALSMVSDTASKPPANRLRLSTNQTEFTTSCNEKSQPVAKKQRLSVNETELVTLCNEKSQPVAKKPRLSINKTELLSRNEKLQPEIRDPRLSINHTIPVASSFPNRQPSLVSNTSTSGSLIATPKSTLNCVKSILRNCSPNTPLIRNKSGGCIANKVTEKVLPSVKSRISQFILMALQWKTLWLQEQKQFRDPPPLFANGCVNKVMDIYSSPEEYKKTYGSLIALESWNEISEDNESNNNPLTLQFCLVDYKYNNSSNTLSMELYGYGVTDRLDARDLRSGWLGTLGVYVIEDGKPTSSHSNLNNKTESTSNQHSKSAKLIFAYVEECEVCMRNALPEDMPLSLQSMLKNSKNLVVKLIIRTKAINISSICKDKTMKLTVINYILPVVRKYDAVHTLNKTYLGQLIVNSNALNLMPEEHFLKSFTDENELNGSQKDAVIRATAMCWHKVETPNICLIHGPPGTGKTKVITAIIKELIIKKGFHGTFLVCAPSNSAVDEITQRLIGLKKELKEKNIGHIHLVRINQHPNMMEEIREYTVDKYLERKRNAIKSDHKENVKPQVSTIDSKREVIAKANVITTTLGSCSRSEMDILNSKQIICIMDEATQCVEPEAILPFSYPVKKLILVGDHKQLPATVKSIHASNLSYQKSLFERLFSIYSKKDCKAILPLNVQYRMHSEICVYPSSTFYNRKLFTAKGLDNLRDGFPFHHYQVFNVCDGQEMKSGKDIINQNESDFVYKLCQIILKKTNLSVGIITFYSAQKNFLDKRKNAMLQEKAKYVEINTVDAFQGREKDVIILSAVRANGNHNIGFTSSCNRINVALTRGRYALYVVGHLETLQTNEVWKHIADDAKQRRTLTTVSSSFENDEIEALVKKKIIPV